MALTYRKLLEVLSKTPENQLDDNVTIFGHDDEFYPINRIAESNDSNDILHTGHIYLSCPYQLYENDKPIN
jgi:hypothetical protein